MKLSEMFIRSLKSADMLEKIYCLFKSEPEVISGFAGLEKEFKALPEPVSFETLEMEPLLEPAGRAEFFNCMKREKNALLITDTELGAGEFMPVAGLLDENNGNSLSYKYVFESFEGITLDYFVMVYNRFYGLPLEILETERLRVREMTLDDVERLYEIYAEPSVTEYMEEIYPDNKEKSVFFESYIENMYGFYGYGLWMVIEKSSERIIGIAGFSNREIGEEVYLELGYAISGEKQRQGYATEVLSAILNYAKSELGATQVIALISPENEASIKTARKLGFREVCENTPGVQAKYLEFRIEL